MWWGPWPHGTKSDRWRSWMLRSATCVGRPQQTWLAPIKTLDAKACVCVPGWQHSLRVVTHRFWGKLSAAHMPLLGGDNEKLQFLGCCPTYSSTDFSLYPLAEINHNHEFSSFPEFCEFIWLIAEPDLRTVNSDFENLWTQLAISLTWYNYGLYKGQSNTNLLPMASQAGVLLPTKKKYLKTEYILTVQLTDLFNPLQ